VIGQSCSSEPQIKHPVSGLGFRGYCEDEKNREKILSLDFLLLLWQDKSKKRKNNHTI
jgi:hypothetical protein